MDSERGSYPGMPPTAAPSTWPQSETASRTERAVGTVERAGEAVKDVLGKARQKVAEYQSKGLDEVSAEVAEYTRSQPVPALLIAAGVGLLLGVLLGRSQR